MVQLCNYCSFGSLPKPLISFKQKQNTPLWSQIAHICHGPSPHGPCEFGSPFLKTGLVQGRLSFWEWSLWPHSLPKQKVTSSTLGPVSTFLLSLLTQWCLCLVSLFQTVTLTRKFCFHKMGISVLHSAWSACADLAGDEVSLSSWHTAMVTAQEEDVATFPAYCSLLPSRTSAPQATMSGCWSQCACCALCCSVCRMFY